MGKVCDQTEGKTVGMTHDLYKLTVLVPIKGMITAELELVAREERQKTTKKPTQTEKQKKKLPKLIKRRDSKSA